MAVHQEYLGGGRNGSGAFGIARPRSVLLGRARYRSATLGIARPRSVLLGRDRYRSTALDCSPARKSLCENGNVWPLADDLME
jgi:hypothetical protein